MESISENNDRRSLLLFIAVLLPKFLVLVFNIFPHAAFIVRRSTYARKMVQLWSRMLSQITNVLRRLLTFACHFVFITSAACKCTIYFLALHVINSHACNALFCFVILSAEFNKPTAINLLRYVYHQKGY